MASHLPECHLYEHDDIGHFDESECDKDCVGPCICDRLRSCEQRTYSEAAEEMMRGTIQLENTRIRDEGYAAGLDAARDAVERASSLLQPLGPALAAIDALRGES